MYVWMDGWMHACMNACKDVFMHVCMHVCGTVRGRHKDMHYTHMCVYTYPHRQIPMHVHVFVKEREERVGGKGGREAGTCKHACVRVLLMHTCVHTNEHTYVQTY